MGDFDRLCVGFGAVFVFSVLFAVEGVSVVFSVSDHWVHCGEWVVGGSGSVSDGYAGHLRCVGVNGVFHVRLCCVEAVWLCVRTIGVSYPEFIRITDIGQVGLLYHSFKMELLSGVNPNNSYLFSNEQSIDINNALRVLFSTFPVIGSHHQCINLILYRNLNFFTII